MAEQNDDLLRQQTGILFSLCKSSVGLLELPVTTQAWTAQRHEDAPKKAKTSLWLIALALVLAAGLIAYWKHELLIWLPLAAALVLGVIALIVGKPKAAPESEIKVTMRPNVEKVLSFVDAQMQAIDRHVNDFAYLNEQRGSLTAPCEARSAETVAELMQAIYECEGDAKEDAQNAADRLLMSLGMRAVPYSGEEARLFTLLPSKTETRTIVPALVAADDGRLLYRGTAATAERAS